MAEQFCCGLMPTEELLRISAYRPPLFLPSNYLSFPPSKIVLKWKTIESLRRKLMPRKRN